jgi:DNA-binding XRE family transcriptional regulator
MSPQAEPFYVEVGRRIHSLRVGMKLKQADLALKLEPPVTRASIANLENGRQRLLLHTAAQIAGILECQISDLVPSIAPLNASSGAADLQQELKNHKIPGSARTRIGRRLLISSRRNGA